MVIIQIRKILKRETSKIWEKLWSKAEQTLCFTLKEEDLFDPANLAKYKKEIEEKRRLAKASPGEVI